MPVNVEARAAGVPAGRLTSLEPQRFADRHNAAVPPTVSSLDPHRATRRPSPSAEQPARPPAFLSTLLGGRGGDDAAQGERRTPALRRTQPHPQPQTARYTRPAADSQRTRSPARADQLEPPSLALRREYDPFARPARGASAGASARRRSKSVGDGALATPRTGAPPTRATPAAAKRTSSPPAMPAAAPNSGRMFSKAAASKAAKRSTSPRNLPAHVAALFAANGSPVVNDASVRTVSASQPAREVGPSVTTQPHRVPSASAHGHTHRRLSGDRHAVPRGLPPGKKAAQATAGSLLRTGNGVLANQKAQRVVQANHPGDAQCGSPPRMREGSPDRPRTLALCEVSGMLKDADRQRVRQEAAWAAMLPSGPVPVHPVTSPAGVMSPFPNGALADGDATPAAIRAVAGGEQSHFEGRGESPVHTFTPETFQRVKQQPAPLDGITSPTVDSARRPPQHILARPAQSPVTPSGVSPLVPSTWAAHRTQLPPQAFVSPRTAGRDPSPTPPSRTGGSGLHVFHADLKSPTSAQRPVQPRPHPAASPVVSDGVSPLYPARSVHAAAQLPPYAQTTPGAPGSPEELETPVDVKGAKGRSSSRPAAFTVGRILDFMSPGEKNGEAEEKKIPTADAAAAAAAAAAAGITSPPAQCPAPPQIHPYGTPVADVSPLVAGGSVNKVPAAADVKTPEGQALFPPGSCGVMTPDA